MRWNGRLMPIGFTSGDIPSLAMNLPLLKNYSIVGALPAPGPSGFPTKERTADMIMALVAEGKLRPHIDRVLPAAKCAGTLQVARFSHSLDPKQTLLYGKTSANGGACLMIHAPARRLGH
jgi:hypothetical protein